MKKFFFLMLILFSLFFPYSEPPITSVLSHNQNISSSFFSSTYMGSSGTIGYGYNIHLLSISPSVDNRISSSEESFVFWSADFKYYNADGNCGEKFFLNQNIQYSFKFDFMNNSKTISGSASSPSGLPAYIKVPFSEQELNVTKADEKIHVNLTWNAVVTFRECERFGSDPASYCSCTDVSHSLSGTDSNEYYVDGGPLVHFISKPVLNEQWYKNNHFDSILTSNRKFYKADIELDGKTIVYFRLYNFTINESENGLQYISPVKICLNCSDFAEFDTFANPYLLDHANSTYSFVYQFNSTYEALGEHNLSIVLTDYFGNNFTFTRSILSTMLTYNKNISETGEFIDPDKKEYRKSAGFDTKELNSIIIPASLLSLLVIISFLRFRLR